MRRSQTIAIVMSEHHGGSPIQAALIMILLAGGGWYGYKNFNTDSGGLSLGSFDVSRANESFISYRDAPVMIGPGNTLIPNTSELNDNEPSSGQFGVPVVSSIPQQSMFVTTDAAQTYRLESTGELAAVDSSYTGVDRWHGKLAQSPGFTAGADVSFDSINPMVSPLGDGRVTVRQSASPRRRYQPIKVASWALGGFGPTKLASSDVRKYVSKVVRRYDVIALQQVASIERDLIPRLVDVINGPEHRYDYVIGPAIGPKGRQEQFAFLFDTTKLMVDRRQTYTMSDPAEVMSYDPLVASFQAAEPPATEAWTFTLVNIRIDLADASREVAKLPTILKSVRADGRGEDDVILLGVFQADDEYLGPTMGMKDVHLAVQHRSTDVYGRFQTSNLVIERASSSEFLGRGGVFDYRRNYDLNPIQAEAVTSHLPVFAEFTAHEGGEL